MIAERLREASDEVQDTFAAARAALDGHAVSGEFTQDGEAAIAEMLLQREELGWAA